ncbi:MAG: hypothetical protein ACLFUB_08245 [Cyclobacteriaceae bacterium]
MHKNYTCQKNQKLIKSYISFIKLDIYLNSIIIYLNFDINNDDYTMKTYPKIQSAFSFLPLLFVLILSSSCSEEEVVISGDPSLVFFESEYHEVAEGSGIYKVIVKMDKPQNSKTAVHFTLNSNAEAVHSGIHETADFELLTESPIIIPEGAQQAEIELFIIEDERFEQNPEMINFKLEAVLSGNAEVAASASEFALMIKENDYELSLEWNTETQNPDDANINLFVELPNHYLFSSSNENGFEKLTLTNVNDKNEYLVNILYADGISPADFSLRCFSAGNDEGQVLVNGSFAKIDSIQSEGRAEVLKNYRMKKSGGELKIIW